MSIKREKICKNCNTSFITSDIRTRYCNSKCRRAKETKSTKLKDRRIGNIPQNSFWLWVAAQCKRAETVEILSNVDLQALESLYNTHAKCYGWNGSINRYSLCHVSPVSHSSTVGLLNDRNLFIGLTQLNQKFGNLNAGKGEYVYKVDLLPKWLIKASDKTELILKKVRLYLGKKFDEYIANNPVRKSSRVNLIAKIEKVYCSINPLSEMKLKELRELDSLISGKRVFNIELLTRRTLDITINELERMATLNADTYYADDLTFLSNNLKLVAQAVANNDSNKGLGKISATHHRGWLRFKPFKRVNKKDLSTLRDYSNYISFETLSGKPLDRDSLTNTLRKYLKLSDFTVTDRPEMLNDKFSYIGDEYRLFHSNVNTFMQAMNDSHFYWFPTQNFAH